MRDDGIDTLLLCVFLIACILSDDANALDRINECGNAFAECLRVATEGE